LTASWALEVDASFPQRAATRWAARARAAVAERGVFHCMLAGGSTPRALYELLASPPLRAAVPWEQVWLWLGDERAVGPGHPDSNWGMIEASLLAPLAPRQVAGQERLRGEAPDLDAEAQRYAQRLGTVLAPAAGAPPVLDLVLLGLGEDGHTASLFPGTAALREQERWVLPNWVERLGTWRLTVSFSLLAAAREVWLLSRVEGKERALGQLAGGHDPGPAARALRSARAATCWVDRAP